MTAVFADLVGSTALGERLDPEELKLVVGEAIARMIGAVEAFGGTVKDLAGDGVLALFGAPTAHEDDPERAVRAALRIVEEIAEYAREVERAWGIDGFGVRVGVNTGPVVVGAIGARLPGGVRGPRRRGQHRRPAAGARRAGDGARRRADAASGRAAVRLGRPGGVELKGKAEPVAARAALAAAGDHRRTRGLEGVQAALVGRDRELAPGARAVEASLAGTGGVLFVTGEPGIGKSRLLAELRGLFEADAAARARRSGSRDGACRTASRCRTGRSATCCGPGSASWPTTPSSACASRCAGRSTPVRRRAGEIYPYLGALLGLTLEPDAARASPSSPPRRSSTARSRWSARSRAARRGRSRRGRARGPALGGRDVAPAPGAAARGHRAARSCWS